jgi:hypothetical protein
MRPTRWVGVCLSRGGFCVAALACTKCPSAASPPLQEFKTTALQAAVEYGFLRMVQVLIELGASVNLAHPKTGGSSFYCCG